MATTSESINRFLMRNALRYKWERVPGPDWPVASHLTRVQSPNSYVQGGSVALGSEWSAASHEKSPNSSVQGTELNNALRMFVTSLLSSSLVPRAAIITVSATDRSSGSWNVNELLNESVSC